MSEQRPVELCADCPLRTLLPDGAAEEPDKARHISVVGERAIPQTWIGNDGSGHVEVDNAGGATEIEIAVLSEGIETGPAFWIKGGKWRLADVEASFQACSEPDVIKTGFLKLRKQQACGALTSIR